MSYFVSRQSYYYSGESCVEVAAGGLDYSGADMLCSKYPGEGQEYTDPREAAKVAMEISRQWQKDCLEEEILISFGNTMGMFTELESGPTNELLEWANRQWESLPKCDRCGEVYTEGEMWLLEESYGEAFCSEHCAELSHWEYIADHSEVV